MDKDYKSYNPYFIISHPVSTNFWYPVFSLAFAYFWAPLDTLMKINYKNHLLHFK